MDTVQNANYLPSSTPLFNDPTLNSNILNEDIKKSPFYIPAEVWENCPMNISYLCPFGARIWYHRHGPERWHKNSIHAIDKKEFIYLPTPPSTVVHSQRRMY